MSADLNGLSREARAVIAAALWTSKRDRHRIVCSGTAWNELSTAFPSYLVPQALSGNASSLSVGISTVEDRAFIADERAHARSSDPQTSHDAARSLTPETLRESQLAVLLCVALGPATDEQLVARYNRYRETMLWPRQSASGLRSRRAELVRCDPPMVRDSGERQMFASGRKGIVWEIANDDTIPAVSRNPNEQEENQ